MVKPRLMALDVAFANVGVAVFEWEDGGWNVIHTELIHTEKSAKKLNVRSADDSVRRCLVIYDTLKKLIEDYNVVATVAELPTAGSKSSTASRAMGMGTSAVACAVRETVCEWTTPDAGKKALCGKGTASKNEMKNAAAALFPKSTEGFAKKRGKDEWNDKYEHVADAIAAFKAAEDGVATTVVRRMTI